MQVSQQELERFLWEQPRACEARGLAIWQSFYALGRRYRRLCLGPYGEAQQVSVRFSLPNNCYYVQLVVSATGTIGSTTYFKAKRQLSGIRHLLRQALNTAAIQATIYTDCVLVGRDVQLTNDLVFALNLDPTCYVFSYSCEATTGLHFQPVSKQWWSTPTKEQEPALQELVADWLDEREDAISIAEASRAHALANLPSMPPAELADLVVTPTGVLAAPGATRPAPAGQLCLFPTPAPPVDPAAPTLGQRLEQLAQLVGGGKVGHLAKAVGLPAPVLHNLAADRHAPSFETLRQLLAALPQVSPAWLVLGTGPMLLN